MPSGIRSPHCGPRHSRLPSDLGGTRSSWARTSQATRRGEIRSPALLAAARAPRAATRPPSPDTATKSRRLMGLVLGRKLHPTTSSNERRVCSTAKTAACRGLGSIATGRGKLQVQPCPQCPVSDGRPEKGGLSRWAINGNWEAQLLVQTNGGQFCNFARQSRNIARTNAQNLCHL